MNIKEIEDLEFEIFVLKQEIENIKNEEDKEDLKKELRKAQKKYNKIKEAGNGINIFKED